MLVAGNVELTNMQLKPEALNALKLPIKVKAGFLGSVKLKVCLRGQIPRICDDPSSKHHLEEEDLRKLNQHLHLSLEKQFCFLHKPLETFICNCFASAFVC